MEKKNREGNCLRCGNHFVTTIAKGRSMKYCSKACQIKGIPKPMRDCVCSYCQKPFTTSRNKKFCSRACQTRFHANKSYNKRKDTPEYREKRRIYFQKWLSNNRAHFNEIMREPNRLRQKRIREGSRL